MTDHPSVPPGSLLGGKFRIDRLLGAGAMGTVYAIDHELTRHKRALKLLHPAVQNIPDIVRRFLNEASAAGRAGNPHLVETFDAGTLPSGEPYVVMELLEGETLGALLRREGALAPAFAAELVAQAAEGMEAAHRAGIIHRDLKPENLFVTTRDCLPFIKIMDFGVSKFATGTSSGMRGTQAGMVYGSPAYMSPEQITGQTGIDGRTDVFALGVVLFECLTGALPFDGPTVEVLMVKVLRGDLPLIESLRPGLPPALGEVVRRALMPNREERVPTALALAEALAPFRALPVRQSTDVALAATIASALPRFSSSRPPAGPPSLPPGVKRAGRTVVSLAAVAVIALAAGATFLVTRSRQHAVAAVAQESPGVGASTSTAAPILAPSPMMVRLARTSEPLDPIQASAGAPPSEPTPARAAPTPAVPSTTVTQTAPPATSAHASPAESLGLREDNPFR
jgi:serine/threonine-protein kinase